MREKQDQAGGVASGNRYRRWWVLVGDDYRRCCFERELGKVENKWKKKKVENSRV